LRNNPALGSQCCEAYELSDESVPSGGAQVLCTACQHVFVVSNPSLVDTLVLDRSERELQVSLLADLELLRQTLDVQDLGQDEPTVLSARTKERVGLQSIANARQVPLQRSPETTHLCSLEPDQARNGIATAESANKTRGRRSLPLRARGS
jgi:hypothetical protein